MIESTVQGFEEDAVQMLFESEKEYKLYEFLSLLENNAYYNDFTKENSDNNISELGIPTIIRANCEIYIPEQFDMIKIIDEYKDFLISKMDLKNNEDQDILNALFKNSKMKIPVFCELGESCNYWLGVSNIFSEDLKVDYNDLEDYESKTITIIARLNSRRYSNQKPIIVYDIYKDFLGLNRALRKQIRNGKQEFEKISVEEDFLDLEILVAYC